MKVLLSICVFLLLCFTLSAQDESCDCSTTFGWIQEKLEINYSGYKDKVTAENSAAFETYTEAYSSQIAAVQTDTACHRLISEWTQWFKDGHVQFYHTPPESSPEEIRAQYADWKKIDHSEASFKAYLDENTPHKLEGIWASNSGNYQVGIIQNQTSPENFSAFIIQADSVYWMPGQIKFELQVVADCAFTVDYYMQDHSLRKETASYQNGQLVISNLGTWRQTYPSQGILPDEKEANVYSLEQLTDETILITVPTMNEGVRKQLIQLLDENKDLIESTPNWILDCRGNGGGSDITYSPLECYLVTGDVYYDHSKIYATEDNAQKYLNLRNNKDYPWYQRISFGRTGRKMLRNQGEFLGRKCSSVDKNRKTTNYPEKVVLLIDDGCASSCESFTLFAEQSDKVTTMGVNSAGISDYGNLNWMPDPCRKFILYHPTSRYCRVDDGRGIDENGITPDIKIEENQDWIVAALKQLEGKFAENEPIIHLYTDDEMGAYQAEIRAFQEELNEDYRNEETSPLSEEDRAKFTAHEFFPIDENFSVVAKFVRATGEKPFQMQTSTDRLPIYEKYGHLEFELNGKAYQLSVYQSQSSRMMEAYKDYLFLPFNDLTNGESSYGGGRYIDLTIPAGDTVQLDFNKSYNPYCAYSKEYSCPVPPAENFLDVEILAGIRHSH